MGGWEHALKERCCAGQVVTESMMGDACAAAGQGLALTVYTKVGGGLAEGAGSYQHRPAFILADLPDPAAPSYPAPRCIPLRHTDWWSAS